MIDLKRFKEKINNSGRLPLLTLEEFFENNPDESSIAPNQCGFGRPDLAEMYEAFKKLEQDNSTLWIRVSLHDDTKIEMIDGQEQLTLYGDSIVVCTSLNEESIRSRIDCDWLCADWAAEISADELNEYYSEIPEVFDGFRCIDIGWD